MRFCDKLAKERKNNNLSQEQLADKLGVSRQAVSKWESAASYPDMDKIIQMTKILNCTLEDLLDDGTMGVTKPYNKLNIYSYLQDFLKFITKSYNMFCSMTFKEKIKCLFELSIILLLLIGTFVFLDEITYYVILEVFTKIPVIGYELRDILNNLVIVILLILSIIIFIHLFKIRYLDYFITIEDSNATEKTIEDPIDKKETKFYKEKQKEKIVIRDPKHSTMSFYHFLMKIIILILKITAIFLIIPVIFTFITLIIMAIVSVCHINYSLIFLYIALACLAGSLLCYLILNFLYNFIFNKEINFKRIFIMMISSFVVIGISTGLFITNILNCKLLDNYDDLSKITKTEYLQINPNTVIYYPHDYKKGIIEYNIDNNITEAKMEVTYLSGTTYHLTHNTEDLEKDYYFIYPSGIDLLNAYKIVINDLKHKIIRNYNYQNITKIKIYVTEKDYQILKQNSNNIE